MDEEESARAAAPPDLQILGDRVTLRPSGVRPKAKSSQPDQKTTTTTTTTADDDTLEVALMRRMHSFRAEPLQFLRQVSMYVSGTGWRAYDNVIGQPLFYAGFSENMKNAVLAAPLLRARIAELAAKELAREEREGVIVATAGPADERARRRAQLEQALGEVAAQWTDRMICKFESKTFIRGAYYLVTQLLTRAYHQGIHVASEDVVMLRRVAEQATARRQSLVFLPCHRSHVDYVGLQLICYRLGIAMPVVVAGDNLNFPLVGSFLQHAGAMYIRRSFGDDQLYPALVQAYVDTLLQGGFNFECFIEGGRSRTGKLLPPKFGILSFLLDSLLAGRVQDAVIIPVSTQYDKVIETEGYVTELLGTPKKAENLADFLSGGSSVLSLRLGRVDVRFHEPWSLRGFIDDQLAKMQVPGPEPSSPSSPSTSPPSPAARQQILHALGYRVLQHINDVSVVMPTALVGTVLLTLRGRGVGRSEMLRRLRWLSAHIRTKGGRVAHFQASALPDVLDRALDVLGRDLVGVIEDLAEPVYYAVDRFQLSFYRNMTIHLFVAEALVSTALYTHVKRGGGPALQDIPYAELREQVSFLSSLFRGEFIYASEGLAVNLDRTLRDLEADGVIHLQCDPASGSIVQVGLSDQERLTGRENYDFYCFLIWPFIEASWLAAVSLMGLTPPPKAPEDTWVEVSKAQDSAQFLGKSLYHQGDLSYFEAVNKETLKNAFQRFHEEGIVRIVRSKDSKTMPPRLQLAPEWRTPRDPDTGALVPAGRLWDFTTKIAASRREGKNRRDGATVSTRVLALADSVGARLFHAALGGAAAKDSAPVQLTKEEADSLQRAQQRDRRRKSLETPPNARL